MLISFIMGIIFNITIGIFNLPLGPDKFINRLYKGACSLIEIFDVEYDRAAHIIADLITYFASLLYVFLILWSVANAYILLPHSDIFHYIIDALILTTTLRLGMISNSLILNDVKNGNIQKAEKILRKSVHLPDKLSNSDLYRAMVQIWTDGLVRFITVPVFYMLLGPVPAFLYKTTEIIDRNSDNRIAHIVYKICAFIPEYITLIILRLAVLIFGKRIITGNSAEAIIKEYLGIRTDEDVFVYREVVKTNKVMYFTAVVFILLASAAYIFIKKFLF